MFDPEVLDDLKRRIRERTLADRRLLDDLRDEVRRELSGQVRTIRPRTTTAVSLVASDGGNNRFVFDPFQVHLVRVVDSYGKEHFIDVISPSTDPDELSRAQFHPDGTPRTPLGRMMRDLGVDPPLLSGLSPMIPEGWEMREHPEEVKPGWVLVYRDLCEWAVLYDRIRFERFATDTLIVRDGLLRAKIFNGDLFMRLCRNIEAAIERIQREDRRHVYLVGLAKNSKVLDRYYLAMALEDVFPSGNAHFVSVPREMEKKVYRWSEYARGAEAAGEEGEVPKFVAGSMYFVRFGSRSGDPIWPVDLLPSQTVQAAEIFGYLLSDARDGFPVPHYPRCLQRAHEHAQVVDFDLAIFQDYIFDAVRGFLPDEKRPIIDALKLVRDVAGERYR